MFHVSVSDYDIYDDERPSVIEQILAKQKEKEKKDNLVAQKSRQEIVDLFYGMSEEMQGHILELMKCLQED